MVHDVGGEPLEALRLAFLALICASPESTLAVIEECDGVSYREVSIAVLEKAKSSRAVRQPLDCNHDLGATCDSSRTSYELGSSAIETARKKAAEAPGLEREPEVHRLVPTMRSLLHGLTQPCEAVTVESGSRHT